MASPERAQPVDPLITILELIIINGKASGIAGSMMFCMTVPTSVALSESLGKQDIGAFDITVRKTFGMEIFNPARILKGNVEKTVNC